VSHKNSIRRGDYYEVGFWLVFDSTGGIRLTRGEPPLGRNERAMALTVNVPHTLFKTPSLRATINIEAPEPMVPPIDLTAAAAALKQAIGCDVDMQVLPRDNFTPAGFENEEQTL
jgi:hypothetical protein